MMKMLYKFLYSARYEDILVKVLRISVGVIFVWFGYLKIILPPEQNPVTELVLNSIAPWFATEIGLVVLGIVEIAIGILLLTNRFLLFTHTVLLFHLIGTFSTFLFGWNTVFANGKFMILTLAGEFVIKNITLAISGLVVLVHEQKLLRRKNGSAGN